MQISGCPEDRFAGLFLEQQINVVDSQGDKLVVGTIHVQQKTPEGNKYGPENNNVSQWNTSRRGDLHTYFPG